MRLPFSLAIAPLLLAACPGPDDTALDACIVLDGESGHETLGEAIAAAGDGSTIDVCRATLTETITIDKDLTLQGAGMGETVWVPPDNEPAVVVLGGATATLGDLSIQTTRNGVTAEEGATVDLTRVHVVEAGSFGIEARGPATVTTTDVVIEDTLWGAVRMVGGTLDMSGSRLDGNTGWGVLLESGAEATITDTVIRATYVSDDQASEFDGWGVGLKGEATATVIDSTFTTNILGAVYAENRSSVTLERVEAGGNYFGIWGENATIDLVDSTIDQSAPGGGQPGLYALLALANSEVALTRTDLVHDPVTAPYEDTSSYLNGSYGIIMQSATALDIVDSTISGFNGAGLYVTGTVSDNVPVTFTDLVLTDNGAQGAVFRWASVVATDTEISDTRNDDDLCVNDDGSFRCNWALRLVESDLEWAGGTLAGNDYAGVVATQASVGLDGVAIVDNEQVAVLGADAAIDVLDSTIEGWGAAAFDLQSSVALFDGVDFVDRNYTWEFVSGDSVFRYFGTATDITATDSTVVVTDTAFTSGNGGIDVSTTDLTLDATSFSGYTSSAVAMRDGGQIELGTSGPVTFEGNAGRALFCRKSFGQPSPVLQAHDLSFTDTLQTDVRSENDTDGEVTNVYRYAAIEIRECTADLEGVSVDGAVAQGLELHNATVELDDVLVRNVGTGGTGPEAAIEARYDGGASADLVANRLTITGVANGAGLSLRSTTDDTTAVVDLRRLSIGLDDGQGASGVAGAGVLLDTVGCASEDCLVRLSDFDIAGTGGAGIRAVGSVATLIGDDDDTDAFTGHITSPGGAGIEAIPWDPTECPAPGPDTGDSSTESCTDEADDEIPAQLTMLALTVEQSGAAGLSFVGGTHDLQGVSATDAGTWGLECTADPVFTACAWTALSGTDGDVGEGCPAECAAAEE